MADLEHLSKEFEKVHDSIPRLCVRLSLVEEWQKAHPETHRLEGVALSVAKVATDLRLESMNELRKQIDSERGSFVTRELYAHEHERMRGEYEALRKQIDSERGSFVTRELYDREREQSRGELSDLRASRDERTGEKGILEKFWPLLLAAAMFLAGHWWR